VTNITPLFPEQDPLIESDTLRVIDLEDARHSCLACGGKLRDSALYRRLRVCPHCRFHHSLPARRRVATIADAGTFTETNRWIKSLDPLSFSPRVSYRVRLLSDQARTGLTEAAVTGVCTVGGTSSVVIVLDFGFLGGSMGLVVGEKVALALELAARKKLPAVAVITSGGARIQEGVLSLMQMAKTVMAVNALHDKGLPFISVLGNPATGQVLASFGSMADIILAEPDAHIGFAPFRAVQAADGDQAATDRYTSEQHFRHGLVDRVVDRQELKHELATTLDLLSPYFRLEAARRMRPARTRLRPLQPWEMVKLARHPARPRSRDYIGEVFGNFVELHGDRQFGDDPAVVIGIGRLAGESVVVIAQQKSRAPSTGSSGDGDGSNSPEVERGETLPEGFRKARRAVELAARLKLPIITMVDTPGPMLDLEAEHKGLALAISNLISSMSQAPVATISVLIGEGGSEAAMAFSVSDRVLMMQNAIYTPVSPESGAEAELRDAGRAEELARALRVTSVDCRNMGIIDRIVPEPEGGAHADPDEAARLLKLALMRELIDLKAIYPRTLVRRRQKKFRKMGEYGSRFRSALRRELRVWSSAVAASVKALRSGAPHEDAEDGGSPAEDGGGPAGRAGGNGSAPGAN